MCSPAFGVAELLNVMRSRIRTRLKSGGSAPGSQIHASPIVRLAIDALIAASSSVVPLAATMSWIRVRSLGPTVRSTMSTSSCSRTFLLTTADRWVMSVVPMPRSPPRRTRVSNAPSIRLSPDRGLLGREEVGLVDEEVQWRVTAGLAFAAVEPLGEVGRELPVGFVGLEVGEVEDVPAGLLDDELGDELAAGALEGNVAVLAAEDRDRQAFAPSADERRPHQAPVGSSATNGIRGDELLGDDRRGVGLALATLREDPDRLGDEILGQRETLRDLEAHDESLLASWTAVSSSPISC